MYEVDKLYTNKLYTKFVESQQFEEGRFTENDLKFWKDSIYPQTGKMRGLTIFIDSHTDKIIRGSNNLNNKGFLGQVSPKGNFPWVKYTGFLIDTGKETNVKIEAVKVSSNNESLQHIDPTNRGCYYPHEKPLKGHTLYSHPNCVYECRYEQALSRLEKACIPWYMVPLENDFQDLPICNSWDGQTFMGIFESVNPDRHCPHCLKDCETTKYNTIITTSDFR